MAQPRAVANNRKRPRLPGTLHQLDVDDCRRWAVVLTNALDQGLRFSIDKATFELLYLPLPSHVKSGVKGAIDVLVSRLGDGVGGLLLGLATKGFAVGMIAIPGLGFGLRGLATCCAVACTAWVGKRGHRERPARRRFGEGERVAASGHDLNLGDDDLSRVVRETVVLVDDSFIDGIGAGCGAHEGSRRRTAGAGVGSCQLGRRQGEAVVESRGVDCRCRVERIGK